VFALPAVPSGVLSRSPWGRAIRPRGVSSFARRVTRVTTLFRSDIWSSSHQQEPGGVERDDRCAGGVRFRAARSAGRRRLASELLPLVRAGVPFKNGMPRERDGHTIHAPARGDRCLLTSIQDVCDPRVLGDGEIFETYPRYSPIRRFPTPDVIHRKCSPDTGSGCRRRRRLHSSNVLASPGVLVAGNHQRAFALPSRAIPKSPRRLLPRRLSKIF
jgi:hypothetical protein